MDLNTGLRAWLEVKIAQNISPAHQTATIDKVDPVVVKPLKAFIAAVGKGTNKSLIMSGPVGSGKTSAMALIYRAYLESVAAEVRVAAEKNGGGWINEPLPDTDDQSFWFHAEDTSAARPISANALVTTHFKLSTSMRENPDIFQPRALFLDDFGRGFYDKAGWNLALEDEFFDYRWKHRMLTIVTTNFSRTDFDDIRAGNKMPDLQRIADRLWDPAWMVRAVLNRKSMRG